LFPLRIPHRLHWQDLGEFEIVWEELPHNELGGFLDDALSDPPGAIPIRIRARQISKYSMFTFLTHDTGKCLHPGVILSGAIHSNPPPKKSL
jgi:hypothetical protein